MQERAQDEYEHGKQIWEGKGSSRFFRSLGRLWETAPCSLVGLPAQKQCRGEKDAQSSWPPAWSFVPWSTLPFLPVGLSSNTRENGVVEGFPKHSLSKVGAFEACFSFGFAVKKPCETAFLNSRQPVLLKNFDLEFFLKKHFFWVYVGLLWILRKILLSSSEEQGEGGFVFFWLKEVFRLRGLKCVIRESGVKSTPITWHKGGEREKVEGKKVFFF